MPNEQTEYPPGTRFRSVTYQRVLMLLPDGRRLVKIKAGPRDNLRAYPVGLVYTYTTLATINRNLSRYDVLPACEAQLRKYDRL